MIHTNLKWYKVGGIIPAKINPRSTTVMEDFKQLLKGLGKQAKAEQAEQQLKEQQALKQAEEEVDFAKEMGGVKSLKPQNRAPRYVDKTPTRLRQQRLEEGDKDHYFYVSQEADDTPPKQYSKGGQGRKDIDKLLSGKLRVISTLDLHGYSQEEAQEVLNEFIEYIQQYGVCGEIIHGSGLGSRGFAPVLKNTVRRWLMLHPDVLAYTEPHGSNDGAVLILLKRVWKEENE